MNSPKKYSGSKDMEIAVLKIIELVAILHLKVKMAAIHIMYIKNELLNPKLVEIDVPHKIVVQTVKKL